MIDSIATGSLAIISLYFFLAGFMGTAIGFGFSAAGALALIVLGPKEGYPLLLCLSSINLVFSSKLLGEHMIPISKWGEHGHWRYLIGGAVGAPVGLYLLINASQSALKLGLGTFIMACAIYFILRPHRHDGQTGEGSNSTQMGIGVLGGIAGGFSGFPTAPLIAWLKFNNASKETLLSIAQPFALTMQVICLGIATIFHPDIWNAQLAKGLLWCAPATIFGTWLGAKTFRLLSEKRHAQFTSWALLACAASILFAGPNTSSGLSGAIHTQNEAPSSAVKLNTEDEAQRLAALELAQRKASSPAPSAKPISIRVEFAFGTHQLSDKARSTLDAAWTDAKTQSSAAPKSKLLVLITGKADSYGMPDAKEASLATAAARERTVMAYLESLARKDSIETRMAPSRPEQAPANATAILPCRERDFDKALECLAKARRVEVDMTFEAR